MRAGRARLVTLLLGVCLLLGAAVVWLLLRPAAPAAGAPDGRGADAGRTGEVGARVAGTPGAYDSHPDADVARLLLPNLRGREDTGTLIDSNAFGMRERDWAVPKPDGTVRVVLLGDSYVFGMGVAADQRCGVLLERMLKERAQVQPVPPIEVLHLGITSWGLAAATEYMRRQLGLTRPDLVIEHIVPNDLDDTNGVRGFGSPGKLVPARPQAGDAAISLTYARWQLNPQAKPLLAWGLDGESRMRLQDGAARLTRLRDDVTASGGRYLLLVNWHGYQAVAARHLAPAVPEAEVAYLSKEFYRDARYRISEADEHWNPAGHEQVAQVLYGLITTRGLLPQLQLAPDEEAAALARQMDAAGRADAQRPDGDPEQIARGFVGPAVTFPAPGADSAGQVYGGIDKDGFVAPYAALVLRRDGNSLHLTGRCLARPELDGATLSVFVDELPLARIAIAAGSSVDRTEPLPAELRERPFVAVRLSCDDFVYDGPELRHTICFQLQRVALEP
ncbi:MAG TPA: hypothetical protein VMV01_06080 [Planctomycetota bacterium]|nr:hypothetical protein [Planctomycetota bacterium]